MLTEKCGPKKIQIRTFYTQCLSLLEFLPRTTMFSEDLLKPCPFAVLCHFIFLISLTVFGL